MASFTIRVNPPLAQPRLSLEQLWQGLLMKANDATAFLPTIPQCAVVEVLDDHAFIREITRDGLRRGERLHCIPHKELRAIPLDPTLGEEIETIDSGPDGLTLTLERPAEEDAAVLERDLNATIEAIRQLVDEGRL